MRGPVTEVGRREIRRFWSRRISVSDEFALRLLTAEFKPPADLLLALIGLGSSWAESWSGPITAPPPALFLSQHSNTRQEINHDQLHLISENLQYEILNLQKGEGQRLG